MKNTMFKKRLLFFLFLSVAYQKVYPGDLNELLDSVFPLNSNSLDPLTQEESMFRDVRIPRRTPLPTIRSPKNQEQIDAAMQREQVHPSQLFSQARQQSSAPTLAIVPPLTAHFSAPTAPTFSTTFQAAAAAAQPITVPLPLEPVVVPSLAHTMAALTAPLATASAETGAAAATHSITTQTDQLTVTIEEDDVDEVTTANYRKTKKSTIEKLQPLDCPGCRENIHEGRRAVFHFLMGCKKITATTSPHKAYKAVYVCPIENCHSCLKNKYYWQKHITKHILDNDNPFDAHNRKFYRKLLANTFYLYGMNKEDSDNDRKSYVELFKRALKYIKITNPLVPRFNPEDNYTHVDATMHALKILDDPFDNHAKLKDALKLRGYPYSFNVDVRCVEPEVVVAVPRPMHPRAAAAASAMYQLATAARQPGTEPARKRARLESGAGAAAAETPAATTEAEG